MVHFSSKSFISGEWQLFEVFVPNLQRPTSGPINERLVQAGAFRELQLTHEQAGSDHLVEMKLLVRREAQYIERALKYHK